VKSSISVSKEDYLKAILEAESEGQTVISATLAHWLSVSAPAVSMALRRLKRDGYVDVKTDGIVRLTNKGKETAYRTALRHHLIERMLSEMFGMPWYEVHDEAERLEHAVSPAFEALLLEKLGEKGTCPHGNAVLPETPAQRGKQGVTLLSEAKELADGIFSQCFLKRKNWLNIPSAVCMSATPGSCASCTKLELSPKARSASRRRATIRRSL
jgi:DtxR family Mn-dependent transcriptional regulator